MPRTSRKQSRWTPGKTDRSPRPLRPARGDNDDLRTGNSVNVPGPHNPVPSSVLEMDHDRDPGRHLRLLYIRPAARHEGDLPACKVLHVSVLCPARICAVPRRRDTLYSGDRLCGCRKSCSEFPRPRNLHRSAADHFLSADMDDLLLGLLDGVVRGISVLYRIHLPRKNGAPDDPRRICLQRQRYLLKLYHFRKLQSRTSGKRKVRRYGDLCRRQRSLHNDHRHHPDTAACTVCPCAFNRCHGGLLCYQL